jgi:hypothetical protein
MLFRFKMVGLIALVEFLLLSDWFKLSYFVILILGICILLRVWDQVRGVPSTQRTTGTRSSEVSNK